MYLIYCIINSSSSSSLGLYYSIVICYAHVDDIIDLHRPNFAIWYSPNPKQTPIRRVEIPLTSLLPDFYISTQAVAIEFDSLDKKILPWKVDFKRSTGRIKAHRQRTFNTETVQVINHMDESIECLRIVTTQIPELYEPP
jgi:hypothetical protein